MSYPDPYVVTPSQYWEGPDGQWSSFYLQIGSPGQSARLLVATGSSLVYAIAPSGCLGAEALGKPCESRGLTFNPANSTTWKSLGEYFLDLDSNLGAGFNASGYYGLDVLSLGVPATNSSSLVLQNQLIASIEIEDYFIGQLGLNPKNFSLNSQESAITSLTSTLFNQKKVPSLSWSYTAGARYRGVSAYASLVYGGYDQSKFKAESGLSFTLAPDEDRQLVVSLPSISTIIDGVNRTLLPDGIDGVYIESSTTYIWLPQAACDQFEQYLGLTWDNMTELYLINDTTHSQLLKENLSITFHIAQNVTGGPILDITLPYEALALIETRYWLYDEPTRYFAIKRGQDPSQYTLGRAFLQEAYLIVDYQRANFSIQQTLFDDPISQTIVPIDPVETATPQYDQNRDSILGLGIGIPIAFVILVTVTWGWLWLKKRRNGQRVLTPSGKNNAATNTSSALSSSGSIPIPLATVPCNPGSMSAVPMTGGPNPMLSRTST